MLQMQVADEGEFGGLLAGPAALGLDTALDLDEVDVFQAGPAGSPSQRTALDMLNLSMSGSSALQLSA